MLKSKIQVPISSRMTGAKDFIYADNDGFRLLKPRKKGDTGSVSFVIHLFTRHESNNRVEFRELPESPVPAVYKLPTFLGVVSGLDFEKYLEKEQELMCQEMGRNKHNFYGVGADEWEPFDPTEK